MNTGCPRCPINPLILPIVLYLGEEGNCHLFSLKMSYKSHNLGISSDQPGAKMSHILSNLSYNPIMFYGKSVGTL